MILLASSSDGAYKLPLLVTEKSGNTLRFKWSESCSQYV